MSLGNFEGPSFVAGSIVGQRRFKLTDDGRLSSPLVGSEIEPGVNLAQHAGRIATSFGFVTVLVSTGSYSHAANQVATAACTCGWYAYTETEHDEYASLGTVRAIVEGTGRVTVGTKGFRAEKLRVLAIVVERLPWYRWLSVFALVVTLAGCASDLISGSYWWLALGVPLSALNAWASREFIQRRRLIRKVRAAYPDVEVYTTYDRALDAHPLSPVPAEVREAEAEQHRFQEAYYRHALRMSLTRAQILGGGESE